MGKGYSLVVSLLYKILSLLKFSVWITRKYIIGPIFAHKIIKLKNTKHFL